MVFVEATNQEVKDVVLREMIGRILKDEIEERKRSEMKQQKGIPLQEPFRSVIVDVFNQLLNKDKGLFKAIQEKIKEKYHIEIGVRLLDNSPAGLIIKVNLRFFFFDNLFFFLLFLFVPFFSCPSDSIFFCSFSLILSKQRVAEIMKMTLDESILRDLSNNIPIKQLFISDVEEEPSTKEMNLLAKFEFRYQLQQISNKSSEEVDFFSTRFLIFVAFFLFFFSLTQKNTKQMKQTENGNSVQTRSIMEIARLE